MRMWHQVMRGLGKQASDLVRKMHQLMRRGTGPRGPRAERATSRSVPQTPLLSGAKPTFMALLRYPSAVSTSLPTHRHRSHRGSLRRNARKPPESPCVQVRISHTRSEGVSGYRCVHVRISAYLYAKICTRGFYQGICTLHTSTQSAYKYAYMHTRASDLGF